MDHCIDYRARRIEFPERTRSHILRRHPEMDPYLPRICEVLSDPDLVFSRPGSNTHIYYKSGICSDEYTSSYFVVYVRYNGRRRVVETAYSTAYFPARSFLVFQRTEEV